MFLALITTAFAGDLYINDVRVDPASVSGVLLEKVDVTFDEKGNTRISAPGYKIKLVDRPAKPKNAKADNGVPQAKYWLVTQDNQSGGHTVNVFVNGKKVATLRSGGEPVIRDLAEHLRVGDNEIVVRSTSVDTSGGSFYVFLGEGVDDDGTVRIDKPTVEFGLGTANYDPVERTYTLRVR